MSRATAKQRVMTLPDGSNKVEGVKDRDWFNTDHVPIWYKSVGALPGALNIVGIIILRLGARIRIGSQHSLVLQQVGRN